MSSAGFTLRYPSTWTRLTSVQLAQLRQAPVAALLRRDGTGLVTVRRIGPIHELSAALVRSLDLQFARRLPDYHRLAAKFITIRAGRAFFFSYLRAGQGSLHTIVVVPAGARSYTIDATENPDKHQTAVDVGRIIGSFAVQR